MELVKEQLKEIAMGHGIDELRFIDADELEPKEIYKGRQPKDVMPDAKSLIVSSIYIGGFSLPETNPDVHGKMSRLTLSGFYFNVVGPLAPMRDYLISQGYKALIMDGLTEDDGIPLKPAAVKAGLGWIGKNTLLINRKYGSFQALGGILTDAELAESYPAERERCGSCQACAISCPGNAVKEGRLDRSKCLSSLLEEENFPEEITKVQDNFFFECDICQDACPWNKKHMSQPLKTVNTEGFNCQSELLELFRFDTLLNMNEDTYRNTILPLMTGVDLPYHLFQRNVRLAYRNLHKMQL